MRWSLTLTLFVLFEFLALSLPGAHALPIPEELELFTRTRHGKLKASSKTYRDSARKSSTSFHTVNGVLTQVHHSSPHSPKNGQDADHTYEAQTAHAALKSVGHKFEDLPTPVRHDLKKVFNAPSNMMFVDKSTNRSKGQITRQAIKGPLNHTPTREDLKTYAPAAHRAALATAYQLDHVLKKHNVPGSRDRPFRNTERRVQNHIGLGSSSHPSTSSHGPHI